MHKKSLKIFLVIIFCAAFGCNTTNDGEPYILSNNPQIRTLERQDHKFCNSLDLNSGSTNKSFSGDLYWHCRLSMAKYKLQTRSRDSKDIANYNNEITDLVTKISLHLSDAKESVFIKENKKLDARDHDKCVALGYDFNVNDRLATDQYLLCRKRLIDEDQLDPAYGEEEYLKYPNRSYNLSFVLDNRIDSENKRYADLQKDYPNCLKFFNEKQNLQECIAASEQSKQCVKDIVVKKFKKESVQKTFCQKQSYVKFPDMFLKEGDQRQQDIERAKLNADAYNNNNFAALGIDRDDVELFEPEAVADAEYNAREKQKQLEKNVNSKKGLYTKYELTRLRQKYIAACQQNTAQDIQAYVDSLNKECADIADYKPKEDLI